MNNKIVENNQHGLNIEEAIMLVIILQLCILSIQFYRAVILRNLWKSNINLNVFNTYFQVIADIIAYSIFFKIYKEYNKNKCKFDVSLDRKQYVIILFFSLGYGLIYFNTLGVCLPKFFIKSWYYSSLKKQMKTPLLLVFIMLILDPIFEEIMFRGIILDRLLITYIPIKAIIISTLIFSLKYLNIVQFTNNLFLGIVLGIAYYKTNSLSSVILIRFINNLFYIINIFFYSSNIILNYKIIKIIMGFIAIIISLFIKKNYISKNNNDRKYDCIIK